MDANIKILVVDDFNVTRKKEIEVLEELGFRNILEAEEGGAAAIKKARGKVTDD